MPQHASTGPTDKQRAQILTLLGDIIKGTTKSVAPTPAAAAAKKAEHDKRLSELEKYVNLQIQINLNAWQQQADAAVVHAHAPAPDEGRFYFYVALAGNIVWAMTAFINPLVAGGATLIKVMSLAGATVGSGTLQQFAEGSDSPVDAKALISEVLAQKRGELEEYFKGFRHEWAIQLDGLTQWEAAGGHPEQLSDVYDKAIWSLMFPTVPYNADRFTTIQCMFRKGIEGTLADFNRQWQEFYSRAFFFREIPKYAYDELARRDPSLSFRPVLRISWGGMILSPDLGKSR